MFRRLLTRTAERCLRVSADQFVSRQISNRFERPQPIMRTTSIRVRNSGLISLQFFKDLPDGNLFIAEAGRQIPFEIKRVYFINTLANPRAVRGNHAHRELEQAIFCVSGSFTLHLDDGQTKQRLRLNDPGRGIRLGPMLWHTMSSFSYDCVILVLASRVFEESDYVRNYAEFLDLATGQAPQPSRRSALKCARST